MKRLKTVSLFSIILTLFTIFYLYVNLNHTPKSIYTDGIYTVKGIIKACNYKEDKTIITLDTKEDIIIYDYNGNDCKIGTIIKAIGELQKPNNNTVFNIFNYRNYLYSKKINYVMTSNKISILSKHSNFVYEIKSYIKDYIIDFKSKDYLETFILGDKTYLDKEVLSSYQFNGISHLLSISGMHIGLLSIIILFILNIFSKRKILNYCFVISFLLFYAFIIGLLPSVMRATLLFIALTINKIFALKIKTIYLLIIICDLSIIYNPFIVYDIGFLFSYIVSFYLILFQKLISMFDNYILKTFVISLIAFFAGLPIMIVNFHEVNLLSPFINLLFVPLVSLLIFPLSIITFIFPSIDLVLFNIIKIMESISLTISSIDIFVITLKHIDLFGVLIYYIIISYTLYLLSKGKITGLTILILVLFIHTNSNLFNTYPFITMIDVGQGDSILISLPHNKGNILIDTGGKVNFQNNKNKGGAIASNTISYLKSEGIKNIDYLIITHGDFDHIGEAEYFINDFKVKSIIFNSHNNNYLEKKIIKLANTKHILYKNMNVGNLKIDKYEFKFLKSNFSDENEDSLIIYTKINNKNILLMGDAGEDRENYILKEYNLPKMDILKVGHHGSKYSSSSRFIIHIKPLISLISAGRNNLYGHPHKETLLRLKESKTLNTQVDGSIKLILKKRIIYYTCPLMH